jgi:uncharacterized coiled-coil protein SlyX
LERYYDLDDAIGAFQTQVLQEISIYLFKEKTSIDKSNFNYSYE